MNRRDSDQPDYGHPTGAHCPACGRRTALLWVGYAVRCQLAGVESRVAAVEERRRAEVVAAKAGAAAGEVLEPNSSAALLIWENVWAGEVAQKIRDAGGVLLDFVRLPHEVVQAAREAALAAGKEA